MPTKKITFDPPFPNNSRCFFKKKSNLGPFPSRIQRERVPSDSDYDSARRGYVVDAKTMVHAKPGVRVLHPLPRVGEISPEFDSDPRAAYFRQAEYGLYVRMALLTMVLGQ